MIACKHLQPLEADLLSANIQETYRGHAWSINCREWVYFDCMLDIEKLRERYNLPDFVITHINDDPRSGLEAGLVCTICKDALMGLHPYHSDGKITFR